MGQVQFAVRTIMFYAFENCAKQTQKRLALGGIDLDIS